MLFVLSLVAVFNTRMNSPQSQESNDALDPSVRTFHTTYDASTLVTEWGKEGMKQLF
jgi:hypothetical protein